MSADKMISEVFEGATRPFFNILLNQVQEGILCLDKDRRVVYWGKGAELVTGFVAAEVLGKQCPEDLDLWAGPDGGPADPETNPITSTLKDGTIRTAELHVRHKDGYRLPVALRVVPAIREDGEIIGAAAVFTDLSPKVTIPLSVADLEHRGLVDTETGIPGRVFMDLHMAARLDEFQRYGLPFAIIYADVDNYGKILEKYGRFNAAKVLRMVARTIHKNIRYFDTVGRWDHEEFLVLLLNIDESRLDIVANKLRLLIADSYISVETGVLGATVSMGACLVQRYDSVEGLVKRASQLMLHSKWRGRNKVSLSFVTNQER
jgi:diguanylate cyclase (GGDEF)-like protein/PAS domain S-box-containing protein